MNPLAADLDHILAHTGGLWEELRGGRIFITGGTGFFGCWLLESFAWANDQLGLKASAVVLTRDPEAFRRKAPHLAVHPAIQLHPGDVRSFEFPAGGFSHVVHAATETEARKNAEDPLGMFDTIVSGTRRTLEMARKCGAKKFLLTSSGAVYGPQPPDCTHLSEEDCGRLLSTDPKGVYGEGKRAAEMLCALYAAQHGLEPKMARCFAFVGPYLPLETHFAIGNFIRDALREAPIAVNGDGTPFRSYLYAADLAIWLWTILFRGQAGCCYNVGSEGAVSIAELARLVAHAAPRPLPVRFAHPPMPGQPAQRYVPSTQKAQAELGLRETVPLAEAIRRTMAWHQQPPVQQKQRRGPCQP